MMIRKRIMVWIGVLGVTTLLVSRLYAGGCGMMSGMGSCDSHGQEDQHSPTIEMVMCAYDGMEMDKKEMKAHMKYKGQTLYFCTKEEKKEFRKDPEGYLSGKKKGECKGHQMEQPLQQAQYTCPMHTEVVSTQPGRCPKCRMNLEVKTR